MRNVDRLVGAALGVLLCALAYWQVSALGAGWDAPIPHGMNEDWDWQLTLWELGRMGLRAGELPEWNAFTGGGQPLWANPEQPFLYPPFLATLGLSTERAVRVLVVFHWWLVVSGFWAFGRSVGLRGWSAHLPATLLLGSSFLPGFVGWGHIMFLPIGWLPLAVAAQHRGWWGAAGLALAMPALAGGHYLTVYGVLWLIADGLARSTQGHRLRWLALALAANGLLLGLPWWVLAGPLGVAVVVQRPGVSVLAGTGAALAVAVLVAAPKWLPVLCVAAELARFGQQYGAEIADPYTVGRAVDVLRGAIERPSGHEGQNVFWTAVPLLGVPALVWASWRRPAVAAPLWLFWCFGWAGSTPVNLWWPVHELPGVSSLRVVERFSLLWTPALGVGLGLAVDRLRWWGLPVFAAVGWHLWVAAPQAAGLQRMGPGPAVDLPRGDFKQTADELTNFQAVRANRGKVDCTSAAAIAHPGPVLAVGQPGYRGENGLIVEGDTLTAVGEVNLSAFPGWPDEEGLLDLDGPTEYRAPGLRPGLGLGVLGLLLAGASLIRRTGMSR